MSSLYTGSMDDERTFNKGEDVPEDGEYVCAPCGYHHTFHHGERFTECVSCLSGTPEGQEEYAEGLELWEKAHPIPEAGATPSAERTDG